MCRRRRFAPVRAVGVHAMGHGQSQMSVGALRAAVPRLVLDLSPTMRRTGGGVLPRQWRGAGGGGPRGAAGGGPRGLAVRRRHRVRLLVHTPSVVLACSSEVCLPCWWERLTPFFKPRRSGIVISVSEWINTAMSCSVVQRVWAVGRGSAAGGLQDLPEGAVRQVWHPHRGVAQLPGCCLRQRLHQTAGEPL